MATTKEFKKHMQNISKLVSISLASSKVKKLEIQQKEGIFQMRPQLHLLLRASTGSMKSTILRAIASSLNIEIHDSITTPGMVGSIDNQSKMFIPGTAWYSRNNMLLMDEFRFRRKTDDWQVFLKLMEDQTFSKKLGIFTPDNDKERDGDLYTIVKDSRIMMKTRFSLVIATMKRFESQKGDDFKAMINRCLPYEYELSLDEIQHILSGKKFIEMEKIIDVKPELYVKSEDYSKILNMVRKNMPDTNSGKENFARTVGDITRIFAITHKYNEKFFKEIAHWKIDVYDKIGRWSKKT